MRDIFIGRQAIFDRKMDIYAYELLFRPGRQDSSGVNQKMDGDSATSQVLLNTFMEIGLEKIAGPHRVFVNLTRNLLINHLEIPFPKDRVVMEVMEDIQVDQALIDSVSQLAGQGYQLALDDYTLEPDWDPLLPLVDIVKVEVPALPLDRVREGIPKLRSHGLKLLAEKIETEQEYQQLLEMGFDYFQGYHFSRPKVIQGRRLGENQVIVLRLIAELNNPEVSLKEMEKLICQDAGLSYKILRYINSAAIGMGRKITSIGQAVVFVGLTRIRAWTSLLALSRLENKPQSYLTIALVRAHMCELLVIKSGDCAADTGFTVGLLSILDLLMDRPLDEIVAELAVSDEIRHALLEHAGMAGKALRCALAYESQDWEKALFPGVPDEEIVNSYLDASEKAFSDQQALLESQD